MPSHEEVLRSAERRALQLARCSQCQRDKPWAAFEPCPGRRPFGLASQCRACGRKRKAEVHRRARDNQPQKARDKDRRDNLRKKFGITPEQYDQLLQQQAGRCAICKREEVYIHHTTGLPARLAVDHCHSTGVVRGLLCSNCNRGIGFFAENTSVLQAAIEYLTTKEPT